MNISQTNIIVPKLTDPRIIFLAFSIFFVSYSLYAAQFGRSASLFILICLLFSSMDMVFHYIYNKIIIVPVSGIVSSIGAFLLADTASISILVLLAFITIGSKFFIKLENRHIFNPNNFSLLALSLAFPDLITPTGSVRWGGDIWLAVIIFLMGLFMVFWAKRILVSLTYFSSFFVIGYFLKLQSVNNSIFTLLSPGVQLFIFFMISDPKTSPKSSKLQILFGLFIAIVDHALRIIEFRLSSLSSLALACLLYAIINKFTGDKEVSGSVNEYHTIKG